ncbi:major facilitator superfamily domain-containing protein [Bombardia bombarda]|uniref:Major facilitator superfamily domain-containing protein n=1 Tax=Bombardia bombarda TaxID=252184 RepID=A0AA39XLH9_9PEZI|nr:major facilitator superfamily domain-containing protein [Bombardia bombarda]
MSETPSYSGPTVTEPDEKQDKSKTEQQSGGDNATTTDNIGPVLNPVGDDPLALSTSEPPAASQRQPHGQDEIKTQPSFLYVTMTTVALMSALFLVALDVNILAVAIPRITSDFNSLSDISWYGAAYSITKMALQPTFGRLYASFRLKRVFYLSVGLFGAGSVVCAAAPTSAALIVGRAVQGIGCAGITAGVLTLAAYVVARQKLPLYIAVVSGTYALSSVLGPVLGGVLVEGRLGWRFCFWINLPIGFLSIITMIFTFKEPDRPSVKTTPLREKLATMDPLGTTILIGAVTCLILALQWGGAELPWSDSRVWGCLLGFVLLLAIFIGQQIRLKERALIPMRVLTQRSVAATSTLIALQMMAVTGLTYYLPIFFQASKGLSPTTSGLYLLGFALPGPFISLLAGLAVTITGIYVPWLIASGAVLAIGSGLLSTLTTSSGVASIVGFEVLASAGFAVGVQMPLVAIRNCLEEEDVPMGNAMSVFAQAFGTSAGLGVAQSVFMGTLRGRLAEQLGPEEAQRVVDAGAGDVFGHGRPMGLVGFVAESYAGAVRAALYQSVATAGLSFVVSWLVEWKKVPKVKKAVAAAADTGVVERQVAH